MIDFEIVNLYNNVRDPSWPDISNYREFHQLPAHIKQECYDLHNFQGRKAEICDLNYWTNKTVHVCLYKDLAFVPIGKCAYTFHTTMFTDLGWKKVSLQDVDIENTKFVGVIRHPFERRLKGITEWVTRSYDKNQHDHSTKNPWIQGTVDTDWDELNKIADTKYFKMLIRNLGVGDLHTDPYHTMFGSFINRVNWIPMDTMSQQDTLLSLIKFLKLHNFDQELPLDQQPLHVSSEKKLRLHNLLTQEFYNHPEKIHRLYRIYAQDLKFYYNLVDKFTQDWQHI